MGLGAAHAAPHYIHHTASDLPHGLIDSGWFVRPQSTGTAVGGYQIRRCEPLHKAVLAAVFSSVQYLLPPESGKVSFMRKVEIRAMIEAPSKTISTVLYASTG